MLPPGFAFETQVPDPALVALEFDSLFYDGRFHNDAKIDKNLADELWRKTIENQLERDAESVLLLRKGDKTAGISTIMADPENERVGRLFVFGLKQEYRGQRLGRLLLRETLRRTNAHFDRLEVETSSFNRPAVSLYTACGFRIQGYKLSLHCWR